MKVTVVKRFRDKETHDIHEKGEVLDYSVERTKSLVASGHVTTDEQFPEELAPEPSVIEPPAPLPAVDPTVEPKESKKKK